MIDNEKFVFTIYNYGPETTMPVHGKKRFLLERAFLNDLVGAPNKTRPVPDSERDFYVLSDEQFDAYLTFRQRMKREFG
jgi:hypothetical protein